MADKYTFTTKLFEACANDSLRPIFSCIHFINGYAYASEGHITIRQSLEYHTVQCPEMLDGKSIHKDNFKAIMAFDMATADEDGIKCTDTDGRSAFYEYFKLDGDLPNFDGVFNQELGKGVKSVHFIGFDPLLLIKLSKALYSPDGNIRCRFTGIDTFILVDAIGVENQDAIMMPCILQNSIFE